jgi:hypothetical protein
LSPSWSTAASAASAVQSALWQKNIVSYMPQAATGAWTGTVGTHLGTASIVLPTTSNFYTNQRRSRFSTAATTPNQQVGTRSEAMFFRGGSDGQGGFFFAGKVGFDTWTDGNRLFVGFSAGTSGVCSSDPTLQPNTIGFAINSGSTTISLIHNDAVGEASVETIADQPMLESNQGYAFYLFAKPHDTRVYWQIDDVNTGSMIANGIVHTNLPVPTTMLAAHACTSNGPSNTLAQSAQLGINRIYVETDR